MTAGTRKPYPDERKYEMTTAWKEEVIAELARRKMTRTELAKLAKVNKSTITQMLRPGQNTSSAVRAVSDALRIKMPLQKVSPRTEEVLALAARLHDDDLSEVARAMRHMLSVRERT